VFEFHGAPVPIRSDLPEVFAAEWAHLATAGAALTSAERIAVATEARRAVGDSDAKSTGLDPSIIGLASTLMADPGVVEEAIVRRSAGTVGDPTTVEAIGIVSRLSAVDGFHHAIGVAVEPLPNPVDGVPTGDITPDLRRRRTHVPMPPGPIPVSLDLTPSEGLAMEALAGPLYMTYGEMAHDDFARNPGLNRAQMELISSRVSHRNACFY
jgi:hypothetical protein